LTTERAEQPGLPRQTKLWNSSSRWRRELSLCATTANLTSKRGRRLEWRADCSGAIGDIECNVCTEEHRADERQRDRYQQRYEFTEFDRAEWDGSCGSPFRGVELGCEHVLGSHRILCTPRNPAKHSVCETPHVAGERAELDGRVGGIRRDLFVCCYVGGCARRAERVLGVCQRGDSLTQLPRQSR
jgi:hypothetical protein